MERQVLDVHHKALQINMDSNKYGTIAEIGAGQETARWFFRVGGAAGTIAKAMSAYDMKVSDAIYGPSPRYVSRERLQAMLDHEFRLVLERLSESKGSEATFFAFANTVAARSFTRKEEGHGWLGIRFQVKPRDEPSQIIVHVHLKGKESVQDQESLGQLGVNMIYAAMNYSHDPEMLLESLMDGLFPELVEIDMVDFSGQAFEEVDNRLMAMRLVQRGLADAAMFTADGQVVHIADALYGKAVLIERSRFRPPTHFTVNLMECAYAEFLKEADIRPDNVIMLSEMTLNNLVDGGDIDVQDFLNRVDILRSLGRHVLISNFGEYFRLASYMFRYTRMPIGLAMGVPTLAEIFTEKYYQQLAGGILESFGRMFKNDLRLYVSPCIDNESGQLISVDNFQAPDNLKHLFSYLYSNRYIRNLDTVDHEFLKIFSHEVLRKIREGDEQWVEMVPRQVAEVIREGKLFGCNS